MKYHSIVLLSALVRGQDTKADPKAPATDAKAPSPGNKGVVGTCIETCGDTAGCQAKCANVPDPTPENIAANTQCIAECATSSSNADATKCQLACVQNNFMNYTRPQPVEEETSSNSSDTNVSKEGKSTSNDAKNSSSSGSSGSGSSGARPEYVFPSFALATVAALYFHH